VCTIVNFRDLGGFQTSYGVPTRSGVLYRSGRLESGTDRDATRVLQLAPVIIDLRDHAETPGDTPPQAIKEKRLGRKTDQTTTTTIEPVPRVATNPPDETTSPATAEHLELLRRNRCDPLYPPPIRSYYRTYAPSKRELSRKRVIHSWKDDDALIQRDAKDAVVYRVSLAE
jgi:hypothetical protein